MTASGKDSVYIPNSLRQGQDTTTTNDFAHAEGRETEAFTWAHAEGYQSKATANYSHAEGWQTLAEEQYAHSEGYITSASGQYSHAEGQNTKAIGVASHAEGVLTRAEGWWSHAEGAGTLAEANYSHAGGRDTTSSLDYQTVVGQYNIGDYPDGNDTFVVGAGLDSSLKLDGLKVRADVVSSIFSTVPSSPVIIQQSFNSIIPSNNHSGLYFGNNGDPGSHRIISDTLDNSFNIERHNGTSYTNLMRITSTATAVF
jgi:hypothetical protein